ncbi:MAG: TonB-dependent receptor, partial [Gemmatimonadetes bacterium]|nr:TonB-dependent receptor [Gemmatimonadota bacterium]
GFARQVAAISAIQNTQLTNRGVFGLVTNYQPYSWFTNRLTLGADLIRDELTRFFPKNAVGQYSGAQNGGDNTQQRLGFERYTLDYLGDIRGNWGSQNQWETHVSFGAQTISTRNESLRAQGQGFVVNSNNTIGAAAASSGNQTYTEQTQFGLFGQVQAAYKNKLIFTFAERADKFSSFGRPDDAFYLPKVGVSYVISDESWFRLPGISNARLRASWGQTGRSPNAGAALTTYSSAPFALTSTSTAAGAVPLNPGNTQLKAERGEEYEMGTDFGILKDRVNFEVTYFKKSSKDLLLQVPLPPSLGFNQATSNPFQNIGSVENSGFELAINAQMYRSPNFAWDLRASMNTLDNKVTDLGVVAPFFTGNVGQVKTGLPIGAQVSKRILTIDTVAKTVLVDSAFSMINKPLPGFEAALFNSIRIGKYITVTASIDTKRDFGIYNLTDFFRETQLVRSNRRLDPTVLTTYEKLRRYGSPTGAAFQVLGGGTDNVNNVREAYIQAGDFVRFRELAVAFQLPTAWARKIRASGGSFTVAANNLAVWTDYQGADPEVITNIASQFDRSDFLTMPTPKRVTFRFNLQY